MGEPDFMIRVRSKKTVLAAEIQRGTILDIAIWCQGTIQTDLLLFLEVETDYGTCVGLIGDWVVYDTDKNTFQVISRADLLDLYEVIL